MAVMSPDLGGYLLVLSAYKSLTRGPLGMPALFDVVKRSRGEQVREGGGVL